MTTLNKAEDRCRRNSGAPLFAPPTVRVAKRAVLLLAVWIGVTGSHSSAGQWMEPLHRDVYLTVKARQLLLEQSRLKALDLGLRVQNGVAVLWGPVSSLELGYLAENCLRGMVELVGVRNELHLQRNDLLIDAPQPAPWLPDKGPVSPRRKPKTSSAPGMLAGFMGASMHREVTKAEGKSAAGMLLTSPRPASPRPPSSGLKVTPAVKLEAPVPAVAEKPAEHELELPEVRLSLPGQPAEAVPAAALQPAKPPAAANPLAKLILELQSKQPRFRAIHFEIDGAKVILGASPEQAEALHEMARTVAQLAGVARVVIRDQ